MCVWKLFPYGDINLTPSVPLTRLLNCAVCSQLQSQWTAAPLILLLNTANQANEAELTLINELKWVGTWTSNWEHAFIPQVTASALVVMASGESTLRGINCLKMTTEGWGYGPGY